MAVVFTSAKSVCLSGQGNKCERITRGTTWGKSAVVAHRPLCRRHTESQETESKETESQMKESHETKSQETESQETESQETESPESNPICKHP